MNYAAKEAQLAHLVGKCEDAKNGGYGVLSTGEKLAAAIVLNRPDWIAAEGYTLAEAIDRVAEWAPLFLTAQRVLEAL
jgi:hypothetical protein